MRHQNSAVNSRAVQALALTVLSACLAACGGASGGGGDASPLGNSLTMNSNGSVSVTTTGSTTTGGTTTGSTTTGSTTTGSTTTGGTTTGSTTTGSTTTGSTTAGSTTTGSTTGSTTTGSTTTGSTTTGSTTTGSTTTGSTTTGSTTTGSTTTGSTTTGSTTTGSTTTGSTTTGSTTTGSTTTGSTTTGSTTTGSTTPSTTLVAAFTANRLTGVAPLSVFFDATATTSTATSQPFHDLKYSWSFGDANVTWNFGARPGQNSKNVAYGGVAGHVFETPGTYTVTLTAFDGSSTKTTQSTITVTDPNTVYAGTKTVCVANGSTPVAGANGCPSGAAVANLSSLDTIANLVNNAGGSKRILFKRGDSWDTLPDPYLPIFQYGDTIIGAYGTSTTTPPLVRLVYGTPGTGGSPKIPFMVYSPSRAINNFTIMDIDFVGAGGYGPIVNANSSPFGGNYTFLRLRGTGTGGILANGSGINITDCDLKNLAGGLGYVGIYTQNSSNVVINGNRVSDATNIEHNIRTHATKEVISNNYVYAPAATKQGITVRGTTIPNTHAWNGIWAEDIIVADNEVDAGPNAGQLVEFAPTNSDTDERLRDIIFERNYVHGSVGVLLISEVAERATIRNNLFVPTYDNTGGTITVMHKNTMPGNPSPTSHFIYNNSFFRPAGALANYIAVTVGVWTGNTVYPTGTVIKNNLAYAPGSSGAKFFYSTGGTGLWTLANNTSDAQMLTAAGFAASTTAVSNWKPTGGYSLTGGASVPVWDDFYSATRPTSGTYMGAVQP